MSLISFTSHRNAMEYTESYTTHGRVSCGNTFSPILLWPCTIFFIVREILYHAIPRRHHMEQVVRIVMGFSENLSVVANTQMEARMKGPIMRVPLLLPSS